MNKIKKQIMKKVIKFYEGSEEPCYNFPEFKTEQEAINWAMNKPHMFEEGKEYILHTVLVKEVIEV